MSSDTRNRTNLSAEEILNLLAHPALVEFRNYGSRWGIIHRTGNGGECGEIASADLDNLLTVWQGVVERIDEANEKCSFCGEGRDKCNGITCVEYEVTDEGVEETTRGIAPNVGGDAVATQ